MTLMAHTLNVKNSKDKTEKRRMATVKNIVTDTQLIDKQIIQYFPTVIFQVDATGHYTYLNSAWEKFSGIPAEQAIGKKYTEFFSADQQSVVSLQFDGDDKSHKSAIFEYELDGHKLWYEISMSQHVNKNGEIIGYFGCFTDVTCLKEAEINLIEKNQQLEQQQTMIQAQVEMLSQKNKELRKYIDTNLELENFAYIASHDLKAPLRTVMSFSQLLQKNHYQTLDDKGKKYLDIISEASKDMIYLIDDLLKYSDMSSSEMTIAQANLADIINEVYINLHPTLSKIDASLSVGQMPGNCSVDKQKIYQLIKLLVDNAIKFRNEKEPLQIAINSVELKDHWQLTVADNGIGMPDQFYDKAFGLFKKHKTNDTRSGTGIGLTLARAIVRLHDGKIWIESDEGKGTQIKFLISKELTSQPK